MGGRPMPTIRSEMSLGEAVRAARKQRAWTQSDLARAAAVQQKRISAIENGTSSPRLDTILKVLAALDLDLDVIERRPASFEPRAY